MPLPLISGFPLQNFNPHGYQPMHISNEHKHGVHRPDTSLQRDIAVDGNGCVAASKLDIDEPVNTHTKIEEKENNAKEQNWNNLLNKWGFVYLENIEEHVKGMENYRWFDDVKERCRESKLKHTTEREAKLIPKAIIESFVIVNHHHTVDADADEWIRILNAWVDCKGRCG